MKVRVIDYVGNLGGGVRFVGEMLKALLPHHPETTFEFVSHGAALNRYAALLKTSSLNCQLVDIAPVGVWRNRNFSIPNIRGQRILAKVIGFGTKWHYDVPSVALDQCDIVWLPWVHRHRVPKESAGKVVGSFHDAIFFQFKHLIPPRMLANERVTVEQWIASSAHICVSSHATVATMVDVFGVSKDRLHVVPLSGNHTPSTDEDDLEPTWNWSQRPFLLCPANTFPHKNHNTLIRGVAKWSNKVPLVLTGEGTDLVVGARSADLKALAVKVGLDIGKELIPLGYIPDSKYYSLLRRAWALVMPTLAEGGGSFPVFEAMLSGIPVICSDIPVMREQLARTGGTVLWFDPHDPEDLARTLSMLDQNYADYRAQAINQVPRLHKRSWEDVAGDYWSIMNLIAERKRNSL